MDLISKETSPLRSSSRSHSNSDTKKGDSIERFKPEELKQSSIENDFGKKVPREIQTLDSENSLENSNFMSMLMNRLPNALVRTCPHGNIVEVKDVTEFD